MYIHKKETRRLILPPTVRVLSKLFFLLTMNSLSWADNGTLVLQSPIDCSMGTECYIQNYVDTDPSPSYSDYTCGFLSYDGHKGTDFRLRDLAMMEQGVRVFAAAAGTVRAVRDGMPDISVKKIGSESINGREAGNSVAIKHGDGWETQYSHLRRQSIQVKAGEHVEAGQPLGLVGLSGNTEFPHLHLSVRLHGEIIDPFTGLGGGGGCNNIMSSLWDTAAREELEYMATGILKLAFADQLPARKPYYEYLNVKKILPEDTKRIIFWSHVFGVRKGDRFTMQIISPNGEILAINEKTISTNQAQRLNMIGKQRKQSIWPTGTYKGSYILQRSVDNQYKTVLDKTINLQIIPSR